MQELNTAQMRTVRLIFLGLFVCLSTATGYSQTSPMSYSTTFAATETPISEGGRWINGKVTGLRWSDVHTTGGIAHGSQGGNDGFDDSVALLAGTWGPDQTVTATVHSVNQSLSRFEEVELWLRGNITANSISGYEVNFRCTGELGEGYAQIVRWNGPLASFTYVDFVGAGGGIAGVRNGDIVKASITGSTITVWVNNVQIAQGTDSTFTSGSPGIGFFLANGGSENNVNFGFSNYFASENASTNFGPLAQPHSRVLRGDFNGDGKNDLLLQHTDGSTAMWLMDGLNVQSGAGLLGPASGWSPQQVGDFNGDGNSDILWLNTNGSTAMWLMDGLNVQSGGGLLGPASGWNVKKIGDFNGDGRSDILWENIDGRPAIWLMNGLNVQSGAGLLAQASGWSIQHLGDFNGDGTSDIVWKNMDGRVALWLMNGLSVSSGAGLLGAGTGWSVSHVADLNGDGKSDIIWQNSDGSSAAWLMNGLSVSNGGGLIGAGTGWSVNRTGDFNGDGNADLVWVHSDGSIVIWLMNGLGLNNQATVFVAGTGWRPAL